LIGYHTIDPAVFAYIPLFRRIWSDHVWARDFGFNEKAFKKHK